MAAQLTLVTDTPKRLRARRIPLKSGGFAIVDGEDAELVSRYEWRLRKGYVAAGTSTNLLYLHRLVMRAPARQDIDHRNHDPLDNRKKNLRFCSNSQNQANRGKVRARSGIKGVHWHAQQQKWQVQVKCQGKAYHVGLFTDDIAAGRAYLKKARELFGEFAWSNVEYVARQRRLAAVQPLPLTEMSEAA